MFILKVPFGALRPSKFLGVPGLCWEPSPRQSLPGKPHSVNFVAFTAPPYSCASCVPREARSSSSRLCRAWWARKCPVLPPSLIRSQTSTVSLYNRFPLFCGGGGARYSMEIAILGEKGNRKANTIYYYIYKKIELEHVSFFCNSRTLLGKASH